METEVPGAVTEATEEAPPAKGQDLPPAEPTEVAEEAPPQTEETREGRAEEESEQPEEEFTETWDSYRERMPEEVRVEFEGEQERIKREAQREGGKRYHKIWNETREAAMSGAQAAQQIWRELQNMAQSGRVDVSQLSSMLEHHQAAFSAMNGLHSVYGQHTGLKSFVNFGLGGTWAQDPNAPGGVRWEFPDEESNKIAREYSERFDDVLTHNLESPQDVVTDFIEDIKRKEYERGRLAGVKQGRKAPVESAKAEARSGKRPAHAGGGAPVDRATLEKKLLEGSADTSELRQAEKLGLLDYR